MRERKPLATGEAQRRRLCNRDRDDLVDDAFCGRSPPDITSFADLRAALQLDSNENATEQGFALTGHSTSLVSRMVSAINPRVVFVRVENDRRELTLLAFARGEQLTEMVVRDRSTHDLRFYAGAFRLPCNDSDAGCAPADLFTPDFESDWTAFDLYAEEDLENTPLDCRVCHQPDGPGTPKILRMQEFDAPWTHWLYRLSEGGRALLADYAAAKGDEPFAGLGPDDIHMSQPGLLSATIYFAGTRTQPNKFPSSDIENEVMASAAADGGHQPDENSVPGESATWRKLYDRAKRGDAISVPFYDVKVTDPDKLAKFTQAYAEYRQGTRSRDQVPDPREIYPDDPQLRASMGLVTEPGLRGEEVLLQACGQCHNKRLDQDVSRARFSADLSAMSHDEKQIAINRVMLTESDELVMPPAPFRRLSEQGLARAIDLLRR